MAMINRDWQRGFGQGKIRGAHFASELGPVNTRQATGRETLRRLLSDVLLQPAVGREPTAERREELRRLAVSHAVNDWDGVALAAMAHLADRYADPAARAWLQVMLAGAGHYQEAVATPVDFGAPGRPPAPAYAVLVTAQHLLGRADEARATMSQLTGRFAGLRDTLVSVWDETAEGRAFARLVDRSPAESAESALPVFFHLPFCGGTSTIVALKRAVPWAAWIEVGRRYGLFQLERALALPAEATARLRLVHLHHPFALSLAGRRLSHFTVLRDPVSQLASGYYKRRESPKIVPTRDTRDGLSADFAEHAAYTMANGLTNMLARQLLTTHPDLEPLYRKHFGGPGAFRSSATEEDMFWFDATKDIRPDDLLRMARETLEERFHLVGTMQHLAASHLAGAASLGLPVAERIGHRGASGRPRSGGIPDALAEQLRDANWVDQTLYEEYTARFERDHAELITAVEGSALQVAG